MLRPNRLKWWPQQDLNLQLIPYQEITLPIELCGHGGDAGSRTRVSETSLNQHYMLISFI